MGRKNLPVTQAVRVLREQSVRYTDPPYAYEPRGGTAVSARELGVDEHAVIKTLVMEDERRHPLIVLMHGDREVSTKNLARVLGVKQVSPCAPDVGMAPSDLVRVLAPRLVDVAVGGSQDA